MTAEKWSAVLEIVSFFLVTIDLFGLERLEKLQTRIKVFGKKTSNFESYGPASFVMNRIKDMRESSFFILGPPFLVLFICWPIAWLGWACFFLGPLPNSIGEMFEAVTFGKICLVILSGLLGYFSMLVFMILFILVLFVVMFLIIMLVFLPTQFSVAITINLIAKFKLEGLMLTFGAILFLISKAIILFD